MDTPYIGEENISLASGEKGDDSDEEEVKIEETDESAIQKQHRSACFPGLGFFHSAQKEVFYYVDQKIVIEEGLDSYAGMIWPAALALCHYLESNSERFSLVDKAVLEIGAGTGLVSVVAALLGAWVTATDLPVVLNNLTTNVSRNTRGRCRHTPQVAALPWGHDLERTFPASVYHYDYVLAADVVYCHDFLNELLVTMKHFCQPGTTVIWANKVRFESDLKFTEDFKQAFHTSLLVEDGDMKIFMATCRAEGENNIGLKEKAEDAESTEKLVEKKHNDDGLQSADVEKSEAMIPEEHMGGDDDEELKESGEKEIIVTKGVDRKENEKNIPENTDSCCEASGEDITGRGHIQPAALQQDRTPAWVPSIKTTFGNDIYHYAGHDIVIHESIDCFGAVMWPGALALCHFLDTNRQVVNMQGKEVLELGAGTGLVTIVASLLGASVTATDLPEVLSNLQTNVTRNTKGRCRHTPEVAALPWGHDLERTFPASVYHYDYVLAADVVYCHDFLNDLLVTMKHFCQPGTTVIWANKVRFESDLKFTEDFKQAFHTSLLAEDGDMKIFMATCRDRDSLTLLGTE